VITLAGRGADLAATLGASAVNAGVAIGSLVGGAVLSSHGAAGPTVVALILSVLAIPAVWAAGLLRPAVVVTDAQPEELAVGLESQGGS
jgi:DHA1 family inner membrane transport protein